MARGNLGDRGYRWLVAGLGRFAEAMQNGNRENVLDEAIF
jgi:hypothetical protein